MRHRREGFQGFCVKLLEFIEWIDYNRGVKKEQPPHTRGWPNTQMTELPPFQPPSLQGWFFCTRFRDLENGFFFQLFFSFFSAAAVQTAYLPHRKRPRISQCPYRRPTGIKTAEPQGLRIFPLTNSVRFVQQTAFSCLPSAFS